MPPVKMTRTSKAALIFLRFSLLLLLGLLVVRFIWHR